MKVNFKQVAVNIHGAPIKISDGEGKPTEESATLGFFLLDVLMVNDQQDKGITGEQKVKRYNLAKKIAAPAKETEITIEEAALIKEMVGKYASPLIVGQVFELLEGPE